MSFRLAAVDDFIDIESSSFKCSSYKNLAYPLGCSKSELDSALGDGDFVVFSDTAKVGFVRVKALFSRIAYLDLHLLCDVADDDIRAVMNWLAAHYDVGKYYIQLLPNEQREIECLTRLGFAEEARLKKQLFVEGAYCDLLMMGSEDKRV
ncbi:GNAT family N-acetyltransferase [Enterovibrio sp. ZSDZ35]|uniref:GNAT family N-acetyltransferase n=1 Tax=Enterovibrio qingdaonensis TaxID=2899818 RepID=A0ABT5QHX0_9GAMM|nr:GNAT family protein [Enterovibrio sp. ZSDZ35]MDD1780580.1 GNAT family N-acetyltransferase [Enterovibrio sp. ZSDZ35]